MISTQNFALPWSVVSPFQIKIVLSTIDRMSHNHASFTPRTHGTNIRLKKGEAQEIHKIKIILEIVRCGKISWHIPAMSDCTCAAQTSFEIWGLLANGDLDIDIVQLLLHCVFPLPSSSTPIKHARSFKEKKNRRFRGPGSSEMQLPVCAVQPVCKVRRCCLMLADLASVLDGPCIYSNSEKALVGF